MKEKLEFTALAPRQSRRTKVFTFAATAGELARIARIDRVSRTTSGRLAGFQRPQVAGHIKDIARYLKGEDAILPNPIIVGFVNGATVDMPTDGKPARLVVDTSNGPPGWIVDGQQRFTALSDLKNRPFEVLVSGFICASEAELKRQFVLVNKTRPLPKDLVNELIVYVPDLPDEMSDTISANKIIEKLNYDMSSSLYRLIKTHTNPRGIIKDNAIRGLVMNSLTDGALRVWRNKKDALVRHGAELISEYFYAVQEVFKNEWHGHKPTTSRLIHGAGITAMGQVMEELVYQRCDTRRAFAKKLQVLKGKTAWTSGYWRFGGEKWAWNKLENTPRQKTMLTDYLVHIMRSARSGRKA